MEEEESLETLSTTVQNYQNFPELSLSAIHSNVIDLTDDNDDDYIIPVSVSILDENSPLEPTSEQVKLYFIYTI